MAARDHGRQIDNTPGPRCKHTHDPVAVNFALELDIFRFATGQLVQGLTVDIRCQAGGNQSLIAGAAAFSQQPANKCSVPM
jgi:hypothetical protein